MKNNELHFNKVNFMNLKKERDMLKITLEYITEENKNLKNELNDMKVTAKKNKDMLKEYVYQITNKDKLFEKMTSTIEQLKSRLKAMEQKDKKKEINNEYININSNNHSTSTNSNNFTANNILGTNDNNNFSFGFNILNNKNIQKSKKNNLINIDTKNNNKSTNNIFIGKKGFNILNNKIKEPVKIKNYKEINNTQNISNKLSKNNSKNENNNFDIKYIYEKQKDIVEEINIIKDDIQFLLENKSKSNIREKLNQSITYSLNSSFNSEHKNNISFTSENNGQQSLDNSYMSNISITYNGPDQNMLRQLNYNLNTSLSNNNMENENKKYLKDKNNIYNLKNKYLIDENFSKFINKINIKKDILFLIDGKENVWELIKRGDLTVEQIKKHENNKEENKIKSIINLFQDKNINIIDLISNKNEKNNLIEKENLNLIDIEIKEPNDFLFK